MNPEMKQELVWMPPHPEGRGSGTIPFSYNGLNAPNRVWTLYHEDKEESPPKLPIEPRHLVNAFMEDNVHDYLFRSGEFRYYSRVTDLRKGGVWLLFEYRKHPITRPQY
jgi:hypothetical protein